MRVKYKEKTSLCQNCSNVALTMGWPTSSDFIKQGLNLVLFYVFDINYYDLTFFYKA